MMTMQERPRTLVVEFVEAQGLRPVYQIEGCIRIVKAMVSFSGQSYVYATLCRP